MAMLHEARKKAFPVGRQGREGKRGLREEQDKR